MPFRITLENVPSAGDQIVVDLTDGNGNYEQFIYVVQVTDSLIDIRTQLIIIINASPYFTAGLAGGPLEDPTLVVNQQTSNNYNLFTCEVSVVYNMLNISPSYTMSFDENNNAFEGERSYKPEWMSCLGVLMITFKDGSPYTHDGSTFNNFYGVQYPSRITIVANQSLLQKKTWISIFEIANTIWTCPLIYSNMNTYGTQRQESSLVLSEFSILEGQPSASFKRDIHSRGGKINGNTLKGSYLAITFEVDSNRTNELVALSAASVKYIDSPLNLR